MKKNPSRRGLFWKVYLHGLALLVLISLAVGGVSLLVGRPRPWRAYAGRLANELATRQTELLQGGAELAQDLKEEREWLGFDVSVYSPEHRLLITNVHPAVPPLNASEAAFVRRQAIPTHVRHMTLAVQVRTREGTIGYAVIRPGRLAPHVLHGGMALLVVLAVLALGSIPLARQITAPLEHLTRTAEKLGRGDLSARAGIKRRDEVGNLSRAFDDMAERLENLVRSEKELLANVSHELRTPLARIRVALEIAAEGDADKARACLGEIAEDLEELERLVGDVLATTRLDLATGQAGNGATPLRLESVPVEDLVQQAAARFRSNFPDRTLNLDLGTNLPSISADPVLLRRAIANLLDNARKYSGEDQSITLGARSGPDSVEIEIRDRGIGIDPQDLPHIFTPFFRADRSRGRSTGGVGLGLPLTKRIIEAHHGTITVDSSPAQGTRVRFTLFSKTG